jgi:thiol-disulfide isomerase/thioredoxin
MNRKLVLTYVGVAAVFGAIGFVYNMQRTAPAPVAVVNAPVGAAAQTPVGMLFASSMNDTAGKSQALAQFQGKPLIVNFWATWCAPCVQEMPELNQLAVDNAALGIQVIGIGIDTPANIVEFGNRLKISYPLYSAGMSGTDLSRNFGNKAGGLPYTVLIGADGQVKKTYLGKLKFEELKADLANLKS